MSNDSGSPFAAILTEERWQRHHQTKRVGLQRVSLQRDNCSHAPVEVESKV
ncbi:hypothetical protein H6F32_19585 [Anabaena sp. FACHB-1237]|uniref:hypothetical protein n=1 Tax=Anabaena sp. FACHB-1237 TaxID=2692769 RepID=UPI0016810FE3|nr:hypothetical protein [Anabaena sp. FACHB-1237]MBD2139703.1 hypothetical protein [Anabaena sp. FACHB-1237]